MLISQEGNKVAACTHRPDSVGGRGTDTDTVHVKNRNVHIAFLYMSK